MYRLPSMEILAFLNWMDENNYFNDLQNETIEEFLLNPRYSNSLREYLKQFLDSRQQYESTEEGTFEHMLDYYLKYIKIDAKNKYKKKCRYNYYGYMDTVRELFKIVLESVFEAEKDKVLYYDLSYLSTYSNSFDEDRLLYGIRDYLNYINAKDYTFEFLNSSRESSAYAVNEFLRWLKDKHHIDIELSKIPLTVLNKYIDDFERLYFRKNAPVSSEQAHEAALSIRRAFQNSDDIPYFDNLTKRYRERTAIFKCVFLSTDSSFYELVETHWDELNEYTGNYLDIFYTPEELRTFRGYSVADELGIRELVSGYPCIYLWNTTLAKGSDISVAGLKMEELLQLVKNIVDLIVEDKPLDELINTGRKTADLLRRQINKNKEIESDILENLLHACITLQNNPVMYGNANEDQRNTQIRDLMRSHYSAPVRIAGGEYRIEIDDQSLNGFSASGVSLGRPDFFVKLDSLPFCIIEGINVRANRQGTHWARSSFFEHLHRFGKYDQNGMERNILLVYVQTDCFARFYSSLLTAIRNSPNAFIRDSKVDCLEDIPIDSDNASLRIAKGRYFYNDRERSIYFYVVQISQGIIN